MGVSTECQKVIRRTAWPKGGVRSIHWFANISGYLETWTHRCNIELVLGCTFVFFFVGAILNAYSETTPSLIVITLCCWVINYSVLTLQYMINSTASRPELWDRGASLQSCRLWTRPGPEQTDSAEATDELMTFKYTEITQTDLHCKAYSSFQIDGCFVCSHRRSEVDICRGLVPITSSVSGHCCVILPTFHPT